MVDGSWVDGGWVVGVDAIFNNEEVECCENVDADGASCCVGMRDADVYRGCAEC